MSEAIFHVMSLFGLFHAFEILREVEWKIPDAPPPRTHFVFPRPTPQILESFRVICPNFGKVCVRTDPDFAQFGKIVWIATIPC